MSYSIIKKVVFKGTDVYITSASNNITPRWYEEFKSDYYSNLMRNEGFAAVVKCFAEGMQSGENRFLRGCKFNNAMLQAQADLTPNGKYTLTRFLDSETYADYVVRRVNSIYNHTDFSVMAETNKLLVLRKDVNAVLNMCDRNSEAFLYADESVKTNRAAVIRYVEKCAKELMFNIPQNFVDDKEIVLNAVKQHGCCLRSVSERLRDDKEVVLAAFSSEKYREHLPNIISQRLLQDVDFMKEIIVAQPRLHFLNSKILLNYPEIVLTLAQKSEWVNDFQYVPKDIINKPEIQMALANRLNDAGLTSEQKERRLETLSSFVKPEYLSAQLFSKDLAEKNQVSNIDEIISNATVRANKGHECAFGKVSYELE